MASSRTQSAHSASNSDNSANNNAPPLHHHPDAAAIISDTIAVKEEVLEKKPAFIIDPFDYMNSKEEIEKFKKYEADYTRRLKAKYFSDKTIFGGNIFDEKIIIDALTIKSSKWPGTKSYADPENFEDRSSGNSTSLLETPTTTPNGKQSMKSV